MNHKKVLIITSNFGIEKDELIQPLKALKNKEISVTHAAITLDSVQTVEGDKNFGSKIKPDISFKDINVDEFDLLLIPGGTVNLDTLRINLEAQSIINSFVAQKKILALICHAPWLLINSYQIKNKTLTSFKSIKLDLQNAGGIWVDEAVHTCDTQGWTLITSRCPEDIPLFNQAILNQLL